MALNTFGWTPAEVTTDSAGNVISGVTLTVFTDVTKTTQVTGLMDKDGVTPLANNVVVSDNKGRFGFKASDAYSLLYVYDGSTADPWPIAAHEALDQGMASHAQAVADAQAAADSAAQSASLVNAPADTIMATTVGNAASATRGALDSTYGRRGRVPVLAFAALKRSLSEAGTRPVAMQVLGDSTGNDTYEWPNLLAQYLATKYPAWTVKTRLWNDTTQSYDAPVVLQTGPNGEQYAQGAAGQLTRRVSAGSVTHISGVMDVRVKMAPDAWAATGVFMGRENGAGARSWWAAMNSAGYPQFVLSTDGTNLVTLTGLAVVPFAAGQAGWLRLVYTPDNGAAGKTLQPYTSTDGVTWTALGGLVTSAGAGVLFNATTAPMDIGGRGGSTGLPGKFYEVQVRNGVDGPNTVPNLVGSWAPSPAAGTQMTLAGSPVLTLVNGSKPGADIAYLNDSTRLPKMTPNYGQQVIFLSDSHNESARQDTEFLSLYDSLVASVQSRFLGVPLVVLTQNPENGGTNQVAHAARRGNLLTYATAKRIDIIDTFKAIKDDPRGLAALMVDTIHPNAAGSQIWADQITGEFDQLPS